MSHVDVVVVAGTNNHLIHLCVLVNKFFPQMWKKLNFFLFFVKKDEKQKRIDNKCFKDNPKGFCSIYWFESFQHR
jgi:hypothetical protein